jgi:peroxiredoxin
MASHEKFRQNLELPFELIADTEEKLCHMFGVVKNKDRKSTRLNSSHNPASRMPSSA